MLNRKIACCKLRGLFGRNVSLLHSICEELLELTKEITIFFNNVTGPVIMSLLHM